MQTSRAVHLDISPTGQVAITFEQDSNFKKLERYELVQDKLPASAQASCKSWINPSLWERILIFFGI